MIPCSIRHGLDIHCNIRIPPTATAAPPAAANMSLPRPLPSTAPPATPSQTLCLSLARRPRARSNRPHTLVEKVMLPNLNGTTPQTTENSLQKSLAVAHPNTLSTCLTSLTRFRVRSPSISPNLKPSQQSESGSNAAS